VGSAAAAAAAEAAAGVAAEAEEAEAARLYAWQRERGTPYYDLARSAAPVRSSILEKYQDPRENSAGSHISNPRYGDA
jgi:hypothetical protein